MEQLIEALKIFLKYGNPKYPTHCSHDQLTVLINPALVSDADKETLEELGFHANDEDEHFYSFHFGNA